MAARRLLAAQDEAQRKEEERLARIAKAEAEEAATAAKFAAEDAARQLAGT